MSKKPTQLFDSDEESESFDEKFLIDDDPGSPVVPGGFQDVKNRFFPESPLQVERTVIVLNHSIVDGKLLVYDAEDKSEAWLVEAKLIANKKGTQSIAQSVLDASERPYSWDEEIETVLISTDDVRLGLWYLGLVKQAPLDVRKTVAGLVSRGTLPIVKK